MAKAVAFEFDKSVFKNFGSSPKDYNYASMDDYYTKDNKKNVRFKSQRHGANNKRQYGGATANG